MFSSLSWDEITHAASEFLTGELPLVVGLIRFVCLGGNKGFTLSSDISAVSDSENLGLSECLLSGSSTHCFLAYVLLACFSRSLLSGPLPVEIGKLTKLARLRMSTNNLTGRLSLSDWESSRLTPSVLET